MTCFSIFTPPEFVMILTSKIKQLLSSPKYLGEELKEGFIINCTVHKFACKFSPPLISIRGGAGVGLNCKSGTLVRHFI